MEGCIQPLGLVFATCAVENEKKQNSSSPPRHDSEEQDMGAGRWELGRQGAGILRTGIRLKDRESEGGGRGGLMYTSCAGGS